MTRDSRPNILFVYSDQHRSDWLGCAAEYPQDIPVRTPNLDRLAAGGIRFTNAVCPSPLCSPSRVCLAVGREYHHNGGVQDNRQCHSFCTETFYTRLRDSGYYTFQAGKLDLSKGLDIPFTLPCTKLKHGRLSMAELGFCDMLEVIGKWAERYEHYVLPMDPYEEHLARCGLFEANVSDMSNRKQRGCPRLPTTPTVLPDEHYKDNWITQRSLEMLNAAPSDRPWFFQFNLDNPHDPNDITCRMERECRGRDIPGPRCANNHFTTEEHLAMRQNYTAQVENNDRLIGMVLDEISRRGELDNTLIVYTSDHGEMLGDHGAFGKSRWWWQSTGVPLIVSGPGVVRGAVNSDPVTNLDLSATFLDYASAGIPDDYDSRSMRGVLTGGSEKLRAHVLSGMVEGSDRNWRMVFDGRYRLVRDNTTSRDMLFDLSADPDEETDIASGHGETVRTMASGIPDERPMEPQPYVVIEPDPLSYGVYNVHGGALGNIASPVDKVELFHNGRKISEVQTNLAIANLRGLAPGTHTFKVVAADKFTAEAALTLK